MMDGYNTKEDYCSFSPDSFFGISHNYACFLHDRQYRNEVKRRKTRKQADVQLRNGIFRAYNKGLKLKIFGFFISWIYYIYVRLFARGAWDE